MREGVWHWGGAGLYNTLDSIRRKVGTTKSRTESRSLGKGALLHAGGGRGRGARR